MLRGGENDMRTVSKWMPALLLVILLTVNGGCRGDETATLEPETIEHRGNSILVTIYLTHSDEKLVPMEKEVLLDDKTADSHLRAAIDALLRAESMAEQRLFNQLPDDAELLNVEINRPYATLDFSAELERMGGTARVAFALDQITYTAAALDEVSGVFLKVEGERVGIGDRYFTGEGFMFEKLFRSGGEWARDISPVEALESFMVTIGPEVDEMWFWMGPRARELYGNPENIDWTALAEGLGSWRNYEIVEAIVENDRATVTIQGDQQLEGMIEPDASYTAHMIHENGIWKWDLPEAGSR
jgi:germination protein M